MGGRHRRPGLRRLGRICPGARGGTQGVISAVFDEVFSRLDPYSRYVAPALAEVDRARRSGDAGAGLELDLVNGTVMVRTVNADGPGGEAGIQPGDRVLAVDGQPVRGASLDTVGDWIGGVEGTEVRLTLRDRRGRTRVVAVERAVVPPETVFVQQVADVVVPAGGRVQRRYGPAARA